MTNETHHLAVCMHILSEPQGSKNPVAWFDLEQKGITREAMKEQVDAGQWQGPAPLFENAPDRDGGFWKHLAANVKKRQAQ